MWDVLVPHSQRDRPTSDPSCGEAHNTTLLSMLHYDIAVLQAQPTDINEFLGKELYVQNEIEIAKA
jgi:hypothetical protein